MRRENNAFELNELTGIFNSSAFRNLLDKHKENLQKEVNLKIRNQRFTEAYGELCKLDDVGKILGLIENRITELKPTKKEG